MALLGKVVIPQLRQWRVPGGTSSPPGSTWPSPALSAGSTVRASPASYHRRALCSHCRHREHQRQILQEMGFTLRGRATRAAVFAQGRRGERRSEGRGRARMRSCAGEGITKCLPLWRNRLEMISHCSCFDSPNALARTISQSR